MTLFSFLKKIWKGRYYLCSCIDKALSDGNPNINDGMYSHTEGCYTAAYGDNAHAEGYNTNAYGLYSHAEGHFTTANGEASHAEGYGTTADGKYSHAEGKKPLHMASHHIVKGFTRSLKVISRMQRTTGRRQRGTIPMRKAMGLWPMESFLIQKEISQNLMA